MKGERHRLSPRSLYFYHHQKVIDHVHANHPFCCYYCDTTCTEFDNIIKHSEKVLWKKWNIRLQEP
jgi:hypothetical protein